MMQARFEPDTSPAGLRAGEVARLAGWLKREVWPLWLDHGVDWTRRRFHEHLDPKTLACDATFGRLRVLTRQIFAFASAAQQGVHRAAEAVQLGIEALVAARQPDGGHPWRFDLDNRPTDQTRDLYDHAFTLLAFASAFPVLGEARLREEARGTAAYITGRLRHASAGFLESLPPVARRRQNPHMHLLEAALAAFESFGETSYLDLADELVALFHRDLLQREDGALPEYFDDALIPERKDGRFVVEPGHHYEWVWLLDRYANLAGGAGRAPDPRASGDAEALLRFADRHGIDRATGLVLDEVDNHGHPTAAVFRLWPQAERIKCEARRPAGEEVRAAAGIGVIWRMIEGAPAGLWHERLDAQGRPIAMMNPASSLYHLTAAVGDAQAVLASTRR